MMHFFQHNSMPSLQAAFGWTDYRPNHASGLSLEVSFLSWN